MSQPASASATRRIEALRSKNLRLALVLASIALTFFAGFIAKIVLFSHA
ncbi:MAG TPA: cytochrome oxidase small assembly protein [Candidatus Aquabacterium excrementipullorum]|nr:cytochrome oxidase small assembly protein [Candidatus Aquabacterium excrementipullorum]